MSAVENDWKEPERNRGIELSIEESAHLWNWLQRDGVAPYWEDPIIASIAQKAKSFHKYGPWDNEDA